MLDIRAAGVNREGASRLGEGNAQLNMPLGTAGDLFVRGCEKAILKQRFRSIEVATIAGFVNFQRGQSTFEKLQKLTLADALIDGAGWAQVRYSRRWWGGLQMSFVELRLLDAKTGAELSHVRIGPAIVSIRDDSQWFPPEAFGERACELLLQRK